MSDEITVVAHLALKTPVDETVRQALEDVVAATRAEDGCLEYSAHVRQEDPRRVLFYERWRDRAALEAHWASAHLAAYRDIVGPRAASAPEVSLWGRLDA